MRKYDCFDVQTPITVTCRDTVMIMLGVMDPAGGAQRKRRRLKRRVYRSKVQFMCVMALHQPLNLNSGAKFPRAL